MKKRRVHLVAGARPNFMKIAPLYHALKAEEWSEPVIVHTGQHYDQAMSEAFLRDLGLPEPTIHLGVGSGSHSEQTGGVMVAYEKVCLQNKPDWIIVVGDVNSTMACAIAAKKLCLKVGHVEAGLRSRDMTMPEEINRIVTDAISDLLFTPSEDADQNLLREGIAEDRIIRVGNIMIDSYEMLREKIEKRNAAREYGLDTMTFGVVTLHRPSNVDQRDTLHALCRLLRELSRRTPLVFPVHPRTAQRLRVFGLENTLRDSGNLHMVEPLSYITFMSLVREAKFVVTDSGGVQEETTYLGVPCLTLRENTERPITITKGTNRLVAMENIYQHYRDIIENRFSRGSVPDLWDGHTAQRIALKLRSSISD
jgi:UDP-N-acetylglucosamine 2-epimerase (non-hydrolysing)